jgi:hypothetical protein
VMMLTRKAFPFSMTIALTQDHSSPFDFAVEPSPSAN